MLPLRLRITYFRNGEIFIKKEEHRALVGRNIRKERIARNMSTEELASLLGHTPSSIGLIERGERGASALNLYKLSKIFGVPTDSFFATEHKNAKAHDPREKIKSLMSDFSDEEVGFIVHVVKGLRELKS